MLQVPYVDYNKFKNDTHYTHHTILQKCTIYNQRIIKRKITVKPPLDNSTLFKVVIHKHAPI